VLLVYENKTPERWLAWISSCLLGVFIVAVWGCFSSQVVVQHFEAKSSDSAPAVEIFIPPPQAETPPTPAPAEAPAEPIVASPAALMPTLPAIADAVPAITPPALATLVNLKPYQGPSRVPTANLKPILFTPNKNDGTFPAPAYPRWARIQGMQGELKLLVDVASDGTITSVKIKESSGFTLLDQHVLDWVKNHWSWVPGSHRIYVIPFIFELQ
jgi:TonB family protein